MLAPNTPSNISGKSVITCIFIHNIISFYSVVKWNEDKTRIVLQDSIDGERVFITSNACLAYDSGKLRAWHEKPRFENFPYTLSTHTSAIVFNSLARVAVDFNNKFGLGAMPEDISNEIISLNNELGDKKDRLLDLSIEAAGLALQIEQARKEL